MERETRIDGRACVRVLSLESMSSGGTSGITAPMPRSSPYDTCARERERSEGVSERSEQAQGDGSVRLSSHGAESDHGREWCRDQCRGQHRDQRRIQHTVISALTSAVTSAVTALRMLLTWVQ